MVPSLDMDVELLCETILEGGSVLLYGKPEKTSDILKRVYKSLHEMYELLCSYHRAPEITDPLDFFEPILRLKYGDLYQEKTELFFKMWEQHPDKYNILGLSKFCGQDLSGKTENEKRLPVIMIEGMERLLYKLDFSHLDESDHEQIILD
ncbi:hypothetical protein ACFL96_18050, partial [Thermoproteota archaeon]